MNTTSVEDFQAYEETAYLMASPKNASRLNEAIAEIETGKGVAKDLVDPVRDSPAVQDGEG